jgi:hypothetical protein
MPLLRSVGGNEKPLRDRRVAKPGLWQDGLRQLRRSPNLCPMARATRIFIRAKRRFGASAW